LHWINNLGSNRSIEFVSPLTGTAGPGRGVACVTVVMALLCVVGLAGSVDDVGSVLVPLSLCPSPACWAKGQTQRSSIKGALKLTLIDYN